MIADLIPKGSNRGVREASLNLRRDWNGFQNSGDEPVAPASDLASAAKPHGAPDIIAAYRVLGKTCGGRHEQFRIE